MILPCLTVTASLKGGRGVFTTENIPANTVIEISPVLVLSVKERAIAEETNLYNYFFEWGKSRKKGALGMGNISMYNHDYNANCMYEMDYDHELMTITTVRAVKKGEELCINYNAEPTDTTPVWFDAKN
ncbi:MAG: SET domain-containing protein-lysine N-methyltransferase [Sphingobacteriia bacterium]|nr:SET domain-containing protein-lysine N-methyltransferase [Sphingobacteriia bacterium]